MSTDVTKVIQVKTGSFVNDMPGCPHVEDRHYKVQSRSDGCDAENVEPEYPVGHAVSRVVCEVGVRGVAEPTAIGGVANEPRKVQKQASEEEYPETECVKPRESDVSRTNLERHQPVEECGRQRHHD